jgi:hypothetical protein
MPSMPYKKLIRILDIETSEIVGKGGNSMKKKVIPFILIGVMATLFNLINVSDNGLRIDLWFFYTANIVFMLSHIVAAIVSFRNKDTNK